MTFESSDLGLGPLGQTLRDLREASGHERAPFMLVGALARDIHLYRRVGEQPPVQTDDVDFAVAVSDRGAFERIFAHLVEQRSWTRTRVPHRLRSTEGRWVDIVPFGSIEAPPGEVEIDDSGFLMNVRGYREAMEEASPITIDGVPVPLLPLQAYGPLKLLAWNDRGLRTHKDAEDFGRLLARYFEIETERIALLHRDLFDAEPFDTRIAGACAYGRDAAGFIARNSDVRQDVLRIVEANIDEDSAFVRAMGDVEVRESAMRVGMLAAFLEGVRDRA